MSSASLARLIDPARVGNILIVRQHNQLGDMLCVVPLLRALRKKYGPSRMVLLASPVNYAVMRHHRLLDEVVNFDKRDFLKDGRLHLLRLRDFVQSLRSNRFDLAVVPSTVSMSLTSDLLAYLSGAVCRVGPGSLEGRKNKGRLLYTHPVDLGWENTPGRHQTLRNLDSCKDFSLGTPDLSLELTLLEEEKRKGSEEIIQVRAGARSVIAFHPGAGKLPNRWPTGSFRRVIEDLYESERASIVVVRGPMDDEPVEALVKSLRVPYYLIEKRSIRDVASLLSSVDLLVSNDTGIMHVGAAVGTRVLSLFGPTDPLQWAPLGERNRYLSGVGGDIAGISVESVVSSAREMLREHVSSEGG
jgi:ADP-heptose:LPS heptosyltransferase